VLEFAARLRLEVAGAVEASIRGAAGNREFVSVMRRRAAG
jgi:hypothetical protein